MENRRASNLKKINRNVFYYFNERDLMCFMIFIRNHSTYSIVPIRNHLMYLTIFIRKATYER